MYLRLRRNTKVLLLALALVVSYMAFFAISSVALLSRKYQHLVTVSFQMLYKRLMSSDLHLDTNNDFQALLDAISARKFANDPSNKLYFLRKDYKPPTSVSVPSYYYEENAVKPVVQPFDARFTLAVYLAWIKQNPDAKVPFHWSDWIDLKALNKYALLPGDEKATCKLVFDISSYKGLVSDSTVMKVNDYCVDDREFPLGFKVTRFPEAHLRDMAKILAKLYLYLSFPTPSRLYFLTNSKGSYEIEITSHENNLKHLLLQNGMVEELVAKSKGKMESIDVVESYKALLKNRMPNIPMSPMVNEIELQPEWFNIDAPAVVKELKLRDRTDLEQRYLESLEFSLATKSPAKSFNETKLLNTDNSKVFGEHHDWRFFNGLTIGSDLQVVTLHRLTKTYLQFCRVNGLVTWMAHGSLLAWYWNGILFPWDADTDAQMPIRDLNRLGRQFNQSLVIENVGHDYMGLDISDIEFNGMGMYFVDVGTSITHRNKGNGNNNIDARFIDVHTGLYVDITGLSVSAEKAPSRYDYIFELEPSKKKAAAKIGTETARNVQKQTFNCRNRHFSSLDELSPLVMTSVQNQIGYVPKYFGMALDHEYRTKGLMENNFESYFYLTNMRIWVQTDVLVSYFMNKEQWVKDQKRVGARLTREATAYEKAKINGFNVQDYANLLNSDWVFREYLVSRNFTRWHESQMKLLLRNSMDRYHQNGKEYYESKHANKALWDDSFMRKVAIDGWDYEGEVALLNALIEMYKSDTNNMVQKFKDEEKKKTNDLEAEDAKRRKEQEKIKEEEKKKKQEQKKKEEEKKKKEEEKKKNDEKKKGIVQNKKGDTKDNTDDTGLKVNEIVKEADKRIKVKEETQSKNRKDAEEKQEQDKMREEVQKVVEKNVE